jgi:hypothetical protein
MLDPNTEPSPQIGYIAGDLGNHFIHRRLIEWSIECPDSALNEIMKCHLNTRADNKFNLTSYLADVQRILDRLVYDTIDDYRSAVYIKCSDGCIFVTIDDHDIRKNNGMCYRLAIKGATLVKLMYPDRQIMIGHDLERPSGWNHFFIIDMTDHIGGNSHLNRDQILVIDPSKNKIGKLNTTGAWDKTGIDYELNEIIEIELSNDVTQQHICMVGPEDTLKLLPLISTRHLHSSYQTLPFGINLALTTTDDLPQICFEINGTLHITPINQISTDTIDRLIDLGLPTTHKELEPILSRIRCMWKAIEQNNNYIRTKLTCNEYISKSHILTDYNHST